MIRLVDWKEFKDLDPKDASFSNHCQLIPLVHQIVLNPTADHAFPLIPSSAEGDAFWATIRYWDAAYYYLTAILGWSDPGLGLLGYYNNDRNDYGDYRLQILRQVWDNDNQLDLLAMWIWRNQPGIIREMQLGPLFPANQVPPPMTLQLSSLVERFSQKYPEGKSQYGLDPFFGGSNNLHLGHFDFVYGRKSGVAEFVVSDLSRRVACLVLDDCNGWYSTLARCGRSLPLLADHSWHVEVFAKTIGYLGLFRQSRVTGLWFHGKHSLHSSGNSHTVS